MNELFVAAMESLLDIYGTSGTLILTDGTRVPVRISPLFPASLITAPDENSAEFIRFEASVLVQPTDNAVYEVLPLKSSLIRDNVTYTVCTVSNVPGNAFELGIKR